MISYNKSNDTVVIPKLPSAYIPIILFFQFSPPNESYSTYFLFLYGGHHPPLKLDFEDYGSLISSREDLVKFIDFAAENLVAFAVWKTSKLEDSFSLLICFYHFHLTAMAKLQYSIVQGKMWGIKILSSVIFLMIKIVNFLNGVLSGLSGGVRSFTLSAAHLEWTERRPRAQ